MGEPDEVNITITPAYVENCTPRNAGLCPIATAIRVETGIEAFVYYDKIFLRISDDYKNGDDFMNVLTIPTPKALRLFMHALDNRTAWLGFKGFAFEFPDSAIKQVKDQRTGKERRRVRPSRLTMARRKELSR